MRETYRMWQLVRYFKTHQLNLVFWDYQEEQRFSNTGEPVPEYLAEITKRMMQDREPRTYRGMLASQYAAEQIRRKNHHPSSSLEKRQQEFNSLLSDALFRIDSCIERKFVLPDENVQKEVYLTLKGRKFATYYGLLKEWVIEDIGPLKASLTVIFLWLIREVFPLMWEQIENVFVHL